LIVRTTALLLPSTLPQAPELPREQEDKTMRMLIFLLTALGALVTIAGADQYWIAYEGNDFPENEGWLRVSYGQPERWIEDGCLVIDSRGSVSWVEFYQLDMGGNLDPGPGELFVMEWRLRIEDTNGADAGIAVFSDDKWGAAFHLDADTISSVFEPDTSAPFLPDVFHEYELRSSDMRSYELYIDDDLAIEGSFWFQLVESRVAWGDDVQGAASLSRWDYVRFGVVPEPRSLVLVAALLTWLLRRGRFARLVSVTQIRG